MWTGNNKNTEQIYENATRKTDKIGEDVTGQLS
jgi:hypothetical protein